MCWLLFVVCDVLIVVCRLTFLVWCGLLVVVVRVGVCWWLLMVVVCRRLLRLLLIGVRCVLLVVGCLLRFVCSSFLVCLLYRVCWYLVVDCWLLIGVR